MNREEKNFYYLKETELKAYYDDLIEAEYICDNYGSITKIILRKIIEELLRVIAKKYSINFNVGINKLINNIKYSYNINFPEEICQYINIIRSNGNVYSDYDIYNLEKNYIKHPIELLKIMDYILRWYVKNIENKNFMYLKEIVFKAPNKIELKRNKLSKLEYDILLKNKQIDNLRNKIIQQSNEPKSAVNLNNIIIAIKEERSQLEIKEKELIEDIKKHENANLKAENNANKIKEKFQLLEKRCNESRKLINNEESKLILAETDNSNLEIIIKGLYEENNVILKKEFHLKEQIEDLRKLYRDELKYNKEYIDILNTIEFSYSHSIKEKLKLEMDKVKESFELESKEFNEVFKEYRNNIDDIRKTIEIYRELLKDKINRDIKYREFYRGFFNLRERILRIMYILASSLDNEENLVIKFNSSILKSNKEKFIEYINTNIRKIEKISDEEIKLALYYKLVKLFNIKVQGVNNKKHFIESLDNMVNVSYNTFGINDKLKNNVEDIIEIAEVYLKKVLKYISSLLIKKNIKLEEQFKFILYNEIKNLHKEKIELICKVLNVKQVSDEMIRKVINDNLLEAISAMASIHEVEIYKILYKYIYVLLNIVNREKHDFINNLDNKSVIKEDIVINLFFIEGNFKFNKFEVEKNKLVQLFTIEILMDERNLSDDSTNLEQYNKLIEIWRRKQQIYNDLWLKRQQSYEKLSVLINRNMKMENDIKKFINILPKSVSINDEYNIIEKKEELKNISNLIENKKSELETVKNEIKNINEKTLEYSEKLNLIKLKYTDIQEDY